MRIHGQVPTVCAVLLGVALSAGASRMLRRHETRVIGAHLGANLGLWAETLERELELEIEVLRAMEPLARTTGMVDPGEFRRFVRPSVSRRRHVQALGWAPRVERADRERYEAEARATGLADLGITELGADDRLVPAGDRGEYFPIRLLEPLPGNELAAGFDLASDPTRRQALDEARGRGEPRATAPIELLLGSHGATGFLVVLPIDGGGSDEASGRRSGLFGFLLASYSASSLVEEVARRMAGDLEGLRLDLADVTPPGPERSLESRDFSQGTAPWSSSWTTATGLDLAGRQLTLRATPSAAYIDARRSGRPWLALAAGLGLTALVASSLAWLRSRARAVERLVEIRTADLVTANVLLQEQKSLLQSVLDNLGDGVAVADENGRLVLLNPAAEKIVGMGRIDSGPQEWSALYGIYRTDGCTPVPGPELPLARAVAGQESRDVDLFVRNPRRDEGVYIRVTATPIRETGGAVRGGVAVFRDITERRWAETALRESEARFRSIVEATGSALVIISPDRRIVECNREAERLFGRSRAEMLGEDYVELFVPPEYRAVVASDIDKTLKGQATLDLEIPVRPGGAKGRIMLLGVSRLTSTDGVTAGVVLTGHDVTERREAEEAQRVRQLAAYLQSAREGERTHAAREIHDDVGQALTGLKFEFSHVVRRLSGVGPELREKLASLERLIDATIGSVRRIAAQLRPQILDRLGLVEAIRWQAREFEQRTGIPCMLELPGEELDCTQDRATAVFRILQESLTNVARHAQASRVSVRLSRLGDQMVLEVRDDGRGIRDEELYAAQSFGLMGMQERARMFGGALTIRGAADSGTTVRIQIAVRSAP